MKLEFETSLHSQEQSASLLILLSCLKLWSIKKILDLFSFLWGYSSVWSSLFSTFSLIKLRRHILWKACPGPIFALFSSGLFLFVSHVIFAAAAAAAAAMACNIPVPHIAVKSSAHKLPVHTPCASTREGNRISCWVACSLGSSYLLPFFYFPGSDYLSCRSEPFPLPWVCIQQIK